MKMMVLVIEVNVVKMRVVVVVVNEDKTAFLVKM